MGYRFVEHQGEINSIDSQTGDSSSNDDQDNETYESVPKTVSLSKLLDDFESNKPLKINSGRRCKYNRCATQTQEE